MMNHCHLFQKYFPTFSDEISEYLFNLIQDSPELLMDHQEFMEVISPFLMEEKVIDEKHLEEKCQELFEELKKIYHSEIPSIHSQQELIKLENPVHISSILSPPATKDLKESEIEKQEKEKTEKPIQKKRNYRKKREKSKPISEKIEEEDITQTMKGHISIAGDISLVGVNLSRGGETLLDNAILRLHKGHRYGLVGMNGVGKSSLLAKIAEKNIYQFPKNLSTFLVQQEIQEDDRTPSQFILESTINEKNLNVVEVEKLDISEIESICEELEKIDDGQAKAKVTKILNSLHFSKEMQQMPLKHLSGGWRMRVALACGLYADPDVLLLDEPTNHLDFPTLLWLQNYLVQNSNNKILVVISHDRYFLNGITTDIIHFDQKKLKYYGGNFEDFSRARNEKLSQHMHKIEKEEKERKHLQEAIERVKQTTRSRDSNQNLDAVRSIKSRMERIGSFQKPKGRKWKDEYWCYLGPKGGFVLPEQIPREFQMSFPSSEPVSVLGPILQLQDVSFSFSEEKLILAHVNLEVTCRSRIGFIGLNGSGKSTLLNILSGELNPTNGKIQKHQNLRIAHFTQHHVQQLNLSQSPLEHFLQAFPGTKESDIRTHLGKFGIHGNMALRNMESLSGGQKSRIVFASITWKKPHILIMDEPTNHLDYLTIDALASAIKEFQGGIILVSHDEFLLSTTIQEFYEVKKGQVQLFDGSFAQYKEKIWNQL